jgi:nitroreductase
MTGDEARRSAVWEAVRSKRMIRSFEERPLEPDHLERILDSARHAGSSKNLQRWDFIVVERPEAKAALASIGPFAGHLAGAAAAVALVTPDPRAGGAPLSITWDLGVAAQNMMLTAWELGIGSCPATVYDHDLARRLLGYPEDHHCEYILSFGYPRDRSDLTRPPKGGGRRPLEALVHEDRW